MECKHRTGLTLKSGAELRAFLDQMQRYELQHKREKDPDPPHLILALTGGRSYQNAEIYILLRDQLFFDLLNSATEGLEVERASHDSDQPPADTPLG